MEDIYKDLAKKYAQECGSLSAGLMLLQIRLDSAKKYPFENAEQWQEFLGIQIKTIQEVLEKNK